MRRVIVALAVMAGVILAAPLSVGHAAEAVPDFDPKPGCEAAAQTGAMKETDLKSCLRSEQEAKDKLKKEWTRFAAGDRSRCASQTQQGGPPSYVEVLTCLEMARDARQLPTKDGTGLSTGLGK